MDTQAPWIQCPTNQVIRIMSAVSSTTYSYPAADASDNSGQNPTISYSMPSGSTFNRGTTVVTATATDNAGNEAKCDFAVTVNSKFPR